MTSIIGQGWKTPTILFRMHVILVNVEETFGLNGHLSFPNVLIGNPKKKT